MKGREGWRNESRDFVTSSTHESPRFSILQLNYFYLVFRMTTAVWNVIQSINVSCKKQRPILYLRNVAPIDVREGACRWGSFTSIRVLNRPGSNAKTEVLHTPRSLALLASTLSNCWEWTQRFLQFPKALPHEVKPQTVSSKIWTLTPSSFFKSITVTPRMLHLFLIFTILIIHISSVYKS